jgi:hypothetical protein
LVINPQVATDAGINIAGNSDLTALPVNAEDPSSLAAEVIHTTINYHTLKSSQASAGVFSQDNEFQGTFQTRWELRKITSTRDGQLFALYVDDKEGTGIAQWSFSATKGGSWTQKGMINVMT